MTTEEFSNEFDTLIQSYLNTNSFGESNKLAFDEYEKSVFLTKAQEQLVVDLYSGRSAIGDSFEKTEELRRYLFDLVKTKETTPIKSTQNVLSSTSYITSLEDDLLYIIYEQALLKDDKLGCLNNRVVRVYPVAHDSFNSTISNPFRQSNDHRVLRVDANLNKQIELISQYNIDKYIIRYLSKPTPIILIDLEDLSIDNSTNKTECSLNPILHRHILDRAIRLAIQSKSSKQE